jgi:hypothetical protein
MRGVIQWKMQENENKTVNIFVQRKCATFFNVVSGRVTVNLTLKAAFRSAFWGYDVSFRAANASNRSRRLRANKTVSEPGSNGESKGYSTR